MRPNCGKNFGPFFLESKKKKKKYRTNDYDSLLVPWQLSHNSLFMAWEKMVKRSQLSGSQLKKLNATSFFGFCSVGWNYLYNGHKII